MYGPYEESAPQSIPEMNILIARTLQVTLISKRGWFKGNDVKFTEWQESSDVTIDPSFFLSEQNSWPGVLPENGVFN